MIIRANVAGWLAAITFALVFGVGSTTRAQSVASQPLTGTLVVAVPAMNGLVVCSDKRLFNAEAGTYTDNNVKIRKVDNNTLFVATNTIGFYDQKARKMAFDAFAVTSGYAAQNNFSPETKFWEGLKKEISGQLRSYFAARPYAEWPASDRRNANLLFNLIFYTVRDNRAWSHSIKVYYEKARTPVIQVSGPITEEVKTTKLSGKGREVMTYLARNPAAGTDPAIQKFDESRFDAETTSENEAVEFAKKLIRLTSTGVPKANVSSASDCAMLDHTAGFRWKT